MKIELFQSVSSVEIFTLSSVGVVHLAGPVEKCEKTCAGKLISSENSEHVAGRNSCKFESQKMWIV